VSDSPLLEVVDLAKRRTAKAEKQPSETGGVRNHLLAALPSADRERVMGSIEIFPLKLKEILQKPGDRLREVYFPAGGFLSVVSVLEDGQMVEVATIGREGMLGISAVLGGSPVSATTMVQGEAALCYRMPIEAFQREMDRRGAFYDLLNRYSLALIGFIMQSTACNAVHTIEQRLARWLLMAQDRMESSTFPLTQEFAAMMLGATRPTVTLVAGTLQRAGLITYHRGTVTIVDRPGLQSTSCECYRTATVMLNDVVVSRPGRASSR
jgi:CRP-like cAMP-binding protein